MNNFRLNTEAYAEPVNQQRYILKYFAAYFCEYYQTYNNVLTRAAELGENDIRIMSIGSGPGVDFYAIDCLLKDKFKGNFNVCYTGVDAVDWNYQPNNTSIPYFFKHKLLNDVTAKEIAGINVFVFPKSLTELSNSDLSAFGRLIGSASKCNHVFFVNSYITDDPDDGGRVNGIAQFKGLFNELTAAGYSTEDDPSLYTYLTKNDAGLSKSFGFFKIPDAIVGAVTNLKTHCAEHASVEALCQSCDIDFWPMMKGKYLAYNVLEFARK